MQHIHCINATAKSIHLGILLPFVFSNLSVSTLQGKRGSPVPFIFIFHN